MKKKKFGIKHLFAFLLILALASGCIPNEKVVYIQNKDDLAELGLDTLITPPREEYFLQPRDIISITFFSNVDEAVEPFRQTTSDIQVFQGIGGQQQQQGVANGLNPGQNFVIDNTGNLNINTLEPIPVTGLSTSQLKDILEEKIRISKDIKDISVNVSLAGIRFTTIGEIGAGERIISGSEANILQALAVSGDLTLQADRERIMIIRKQGGGYKIHEIDVTRRNLFKSEFFFIRPGDIIYAPPLKIREIGAGDNFLSQLSAVIAIVSGGIFLISLINR